MNVFPQFYKAITIKIKSSLKKTHHLGLTQTAGGDLKLGTSLTIVIVLPKVKNIRPLGQDKVG